MRASYSRIYIHLIWATCDRLELIDDKLEPILYSYITKKCRQQNGILMQIGGTPNHIHLLVKLLPAINIGQFVKNIKGSSSHYIAQIVHPDSFFKWQRPVPDMQQFLYLLITYQRSLRTLLSKKNTIKQIPAIGIGNFLNKPKIDINRKTQTVLGTVSQI